MIHKRQKLVIGSIFMTYQISNIKINNFKAYSYLDFDVSSKLSVIIGEDNIGKTIIFEILLLLEIIYKKLISLNDLVFDFKKQSLDITVTLQDIENRDDVVRKRARGNLHSLVYDPSLMYSLYKKIQSEFK